MSDDTGVWSIIENTQEARQDYGYAWGGDHTHMTAEHIKALQDGKCLAMFDGEYTHFVWMEQVREATEDVD